MVTGRNKGPDPLDREADHRPGLQLGDKSTKASPQNGTTGGVGSPGVPEGMPPGGTMCSQPVFFLLVPGS